jgi:hypothetical protein
MSSRIEKCYSPGQEVAILRILMRAEQSQRPFAWGMAMMGEILPQFGIYFAQIERLCRQYALRAYHLAVPSAIFLKDLPDYIVTNPQNSKESYPFIGIVNADGLIQLLDRACAWGISYDPATNLVNLEKAGILTPRLGSEIALQFQAKNN